MATPICTIDSDGIHRPIFADCLDYFQTQYRGIYGSDTWWAPEDRDTQFLSLLAAALDDVNSETIAAYNSFSPTTAQGVGLSSVVKIDGIARKIPSASTAVVRISGVVGTIIENGIVQDDQGHQWNLPASVTIPAVGQIDVTATCAELGAISAATGTINNVFTATPGWQTAISISDAALGAPVEDDALLRQRQAFSASLPAQSSFDALISAIAAIQGVVRYRGYQNDEATTDALGIPGHSIAMVVDGGDVQSVIDTIALKKGDGVTPFGSWTLKTTPDEFGISRPIAFSQVRNIPISYTLRVKPLGGYTTDVQAQIQQSLADWTTALGIGNGVDLADAYQAARLFGGAGSKTYRVMPESLRVARDSNVTDNEDIAMAYDEAPICIPDYVAIALVA